MPQLANANHRDDKTSHYGKRALTQGVLSVSFFALGLSLFGTITPSNLPAFHTEDNNGVAISKQVEANAGLVSSGLPAENIILTSLNDPDSIDVFQEEPQEALLPLVRPRLKPRPIIKMASYSDIAQKNKHPRVYDASRLAITPPQDLAIIPPSGHYRPQQPDIKPRLSDRKLFGSVEIQFDDEKRIKSWARSYGGFTRDTDTMRRCLNHRDRCQDAAMSQWSAELRNLRRPSKLATLNAVNQSVNRRPYIRDTLNYAKSDYWASPSEFLQKSGDCEDFALMKFASLLALGFNNNDMRVVVGTLSDGTPHAILAVKVDTTEYILDNRQSSVLIADSRNGYTPKYSMNLTERWSHVMPAASMI